MQDLSSSEEAETRGMPPAHDCVCRRHAFDAEKSTLSAEVEAPIGVFDSGVGGLTILSSLRQELPHEHYIYLGDTAHCPYGTRCDSEISQLAVQANRFLIEQGVKLIVVACNTASQAALATLRSTFTVPFVGVVPAVKPAARTTRTGRIGVAATNNTVKAAYLRQLIDDFADNLQVYTIGCPELVALVEHGLLEGPQVEETLQHVLQPLRSEHIDVLVLGCTHFPALRPAIERVMGKHVQVIDSGTAVARHTHTVLEAERIIRPANQHDKGDLQLWCSGDEITFSNVASKILGYPVIVHHATL